jgi:hypothetical protein
MKRIVFAFGLALTALTPMSCVDSNDYGPEYRPLTCRDFRTCGSCTPVRGCGWCQIGDDGICVSDPRECAVASSFTFNWEPNDCPGAPPRDGGVDAHGGDGPMDTPAGDGAAGGFTGTPTGG